MAEKWDFSGWATKTGLRCSDGRTIMKGAFKHCDGQTVPLIWNHKHDTPDAVLGHALLEDRDGDIYAYCAFNDTPNGREAREIVKHGDIVSLSIFANQLTQSSPTPPCDVIHGTIREVSMVLAGANPGAFIDNVIAHGETLDDEAVIYHDDDEGLYFYHADEEDDEEEDEDEEGSETVGDVLKTLTDKQKAAVGILIEQLTSKKGDTDTNQTVKHSDEDEGEEDEDTDGEETVGDVIDTLTEEQQKKTMALVSAAKSGRNPNPEDADFIEGLNEKQQKAVYALVGMALKDKDNSDDEEEEEVKHNAFDNYYEDMGPTLSHSDMEQIFKDGKRLGSLKAAIEESLESGVLSHATDRDGNTVTYGIADIDYLFPDARTINNTPEFIQRDMGWVRKVIDGTHHTPFSRVKSLFANITADEARAKGYTKGKTKLDEVFTLLKRTTDPQTIYKRQKLDRDDVIDITDFDVVAWIKGEMRMMLEEEIARAILIGDGRNPASDDKIQEAHVRPIYNDADLYTVKVSVTAGEDPTDTAKNLIDTVIRSRKEYKGSGNPTFFTTEDWLTEMLLLEDDIGHKLYKTEAELATTLRVKEIVTVEAMEGQEIAIPTGVGTATADHDFIGVIVNLNDYNVGADKGGQTSFFDDFDIDYNQQKYLYETRMSGALVKPKSALSFYVSTVNA